MRFAELNNLRPYTYVLAAGCFDLFHIGHLHYLKACRAYGPLVVALTEGEYITKPGRPVFSDEHRLEMIDALRIVDHCVMVSDRTMVPAIHILRPKVYCKGSETRLENNPDFDAEKEATHKHGGAVVMIEKVLPYSSGALLRGEFLK
jgi:cytidyltransferase-like protein